MPMEGMRGFSIDLEGCTMTDGTDLPDVGIVDFSSGDLNFQMTPFQDRRVRIVGYADFLGTAALYESREVPTKVLTNHVKFLLPSLTWKSKRKTWSGLRPMTPDNLPYVGPIPWKEGDVSAGNVWVYCGHGSTGWTSATATAEVLSQQILSPNETVTHEMSELRAALRPDRFAHAFSGCSSLLDYLL